MIKHEPATRCRHVAQALAACSSIPIKLIWPSDSSGLLQHGGRDAYIYMVAGSMVPEQEPMTSTRNWADR